jgi:sugar phosphate isomerase/epimerase
MSEFLSRRRFLQASAAGAWMAGAAPLSLRSAIPAARGPCRGTICFFSKVVPQMNWQDLAKSAKDAGFLGIDLTVRGGGHVKPENAAEDLPKAVAAIRAEGLEVPMITTALTTVENPTAVPILSTAAKLSIPYMKPGYYRYKFVDMRKELEEASNQFAALVGLATKYGVQVGFHNDANFIGSQTWDILKVMDTLDPKWAGYYWDIENGTVIGGGEGWRNAATLALPRLKMVGAKDFYWEKAEGGVWRVKGCPIGQGMCNYKKFLPMLAAADFHGPISLHMEYEVPGASARGGIALSREKCDDVMAAAKQNLDTLKSMLRDAYEGS